MSDMIDFLNEFYGGPSVLSRIDDGYLLCLDDDFVFMNTEEALGWVLDKLNDHIDRFGVIKVYDSFLYSKRLARRIGLLLPEQIDLKPGVKIVCLNYPENVLVSNNSELLQYFYKIGVDILPDYSIFE